MAKRAKKPKLMSSSEFQLRKEDAISAAKDLRRYADHIVASLTQGSPDEGLYPGLSIKDAAVAISNINFYCAYVQGHVRAASGKGLHG